MSKLKIGICGKMCSGKSYIAKELIKEYPNGVVLSFASKIKELAKDLFNMKKKDRKLLQDIGTKLREIKNSVWIDYTLKESNKYDICIIDDVRYMDEINALKSDDWILIKIRISEQMQVKRLQNIYPTTWENHIHQKHHISEQIDHDDYHFDYIIDMDKDEKNVVQNIISFLKNL